MKLAVLVIHGIGDQPADYADDFLTRLRVACTKAGGSGTELVTKACWWSPVIQAREEDLAQRLKVETLGWGRLRRFMTGFAADALAYQPVPGEQGLYEDIHAVVQADLAALADQAGGDAPLVVISHSLGTVITSNHLWNLQRGRGPADPRPLVQGRTLVGLHTMGSPIALWSLRWPGLGSPIQVPAPELATLHPGLVAQGHWLNIYDRDDVIGYPLKPLNPAYARMVTADQEVRCGPWWSGWTPVSHVDYWRTTAVIQTIAKRLADLQKVHA